MSQGFSSDLVQGTPRTAYNALRRFSWLTPTREAKNVAEWGYRNIFSPAGTEQKEVQRWIDEYNRLQDDPLSEAEEDVFVAREICVRGLRQFNDRFQMLSRLAYQFVANLSKAGELHRLVRLADVPPAGEIERSTKRSFRKLPLPPSAGFRLVDYQNQLGDPLVLGARLLWWCAAAHKPQELGYSAEDLFALSRHPIWITYLGFRKTFSRPPCCRLEEYPLEIMIKAAELLVKNEEQKSAVNILSVHQAEVVQDAPGDGFDEEGVFWRSGKSLNGELHPQGLKILKILFPTKSRSMGVEQFRKRLWPNKVMTDKALESALSRLTDRVIGHGMEASRKNGRVILVVH